MMAFRLKNDDGKNVFEVALSKGQTDVALKVLPYTFSELTNSRYMFPQIVRTENV